VTPDKVCAARKWGEAVRHRRAMENSLVEAAEWHNLPYKVTVGRGEALARAEDAERDARKAFEDAKDSVA